VVEDLEYDGRLIRYQYLPAVKAYLLDQLGRSVEADEARARAFDLASNEVERDFLTA
jgi:predicted RNA polymerase sigma factor